MNRSRYSLKRLMGIMMLSVLAVFIGQFFLSDPVNAAAGSEKSEVRLIYGDSKISDKDAFVITIYAEGYTWSQREQFFTDSEMFTSSLAECSPWNEVLSVLKIYGVALPSKESGCKGDSASSYQEMQKDTRDTYFGAMYWYNGLDRLLAINDYSKVWNARDKYSPYSDLEVILVNSKVYGGSGGSIAVASANRLSAELVFHETAHTLAKLHDEYYYSPYEAANLTRISDPAKVSWSRFIGKNGIDVYSYDGTSDWYVPAKECKMKQLGYEFCEVCKETLRKSIMADINKDIIYFQPYAEDINLYNGKLDLCSYFVLGRSNKVVTGDYVEKKLSITYYDKDGNKISGVPTGVGQYSAKVKFAGNNTFGSCSQTFSFNIDHSYKLNYVDSKACRAVCSDCGRTEIKKLNAPAVKSISGIEKGFKLTPESADNFGDGVQVQYSKSKNFSSNVKTKTIANHICKSNSVGDLSKNTTYYVRVRAYKKIGNKKIYSGWSEVKTVKTK